MAGLAGLANRYRLWRHKHSSGLSRAFIFVLSLCLASLLIPNGIFVQNGYAQTWSYTVTGDEDNSKSSTPYVDATLTLGIKITNGAASLEDIDINTTVSSSQSEVVTNTFLGIKITNSASGIEGISGSSTTSSSTSEVVVNTTLGIKITNSSPDSDTPITPTYSSSESEVIANTTLGIKITNKAFGTIVDYDLVGKDPALYENPHNQIVYVKGGTNNTVSWNEKSGGGIQDAPVGDITCGATIVIPDAPECAGYNFDGWALRINGVLECEGDGTNTKVILYQPNQTFKVRYADNYQFVAKWSPLEKDYEVDVYLQNANDDNYTLDSELSNSLAGSALVDADVSVDVPDAPLGFKLREQGSPSNVTESWMLAQGGTNERLCIYFDREVYSVSFEKPQGEVGSDIPDESLITGWPEDVDNIRFGQSFELPAKPCASNWSFEWKVVSPDNLAITNATIIMPAEDVVISGTWSEILQTKWLLLKYLSATPENHSLSQGNISKKVNDMEDVSVKVKDGEVFEKLGDNAGIYQWVDLGKQGDFTDAQTLTLPSVDSLYGIDGYVKLSNSWYMPGTNTATDTTTQGWYWWSADTPLNSSSLKNLADKATPGQDFDTAEVYARWDLILSVDIPVDIKMDLDLATGNVSAKYAQANQPSENDDPWYFLSRSVEPLEIVSISEAGSDTDIARRIDASSELFGQTNIGDSIDSAKIWLSMSGNSLSGPTTYNYFLGERKPVSGSSGNITILRAATSTESAKTQVAFDLRMNNFEADRAKLSQADTYSDIAKIKYTVRYNTKTNPSPDELWPSA